MNRRLSGWIIRLGTDQDLTAVVNLWAAADAQPTVTDNVEALRALLATD